MVSETFKCVYIFKTSDTLIRMMLAQDINGRMTADSPPASHTLDGDSRVATKINFFVSSRLENLSISDRIPPPPRSYPTSV